MLEIVDELILLSFFGAGKSVKFDGNIERLGKVIKMFLAVCDL